MSWCAGRHFIVTAPTDRIRPPHPEVKRDRVVLSEEELRYLLRAFATERGLFGPFLGVLLWTGQRRAEIVGMLWSELRDLEGDCPLWEILVCRTKNKHSHLVPLTPQARALILKSPLTGELMFTTTGETPVSGFGQGESASFIVRDDLSSGST